MARGGAGGQARPADDDRLPDRPARRSSPTSCCRPPPGTRSTTSTPPTCTPSCTPSTPPSHRRGRPARTGTPGRPSPRSSASSLRPTSASARTWSPSRCTHDTPDAMANPHGVVRDWKKGECDPIPGVTMPKLVEVERDYGAVFEKMNALGPLVDTLGATTKGVTFELSKQVDYLARQERSPCAAVSPTAGRRSSATSTSARPSSPCPVRRTVTWPPQGFETLEKRTGVTAGRPGRGARGQADHLRRHPGAHPSR